MELKGSGETDADCWGELTDRMCCCRAPHSFTHTHHSNSSASPLIFACVCVSWQASSIMQHWDMMPCPHYRAPILLFLCFHDRSPLLFTACLVRYLFSKLTMLLSVCAATRKPLKQREGAGNIWNKISGTDWGDPKWIFAWKLSGWLTHCEEKFKFHADGCDTTAEGNDCCMHLVMSRDVTPESQRCPSVQLIIAWIALLLFCPWIQYP